jgi:hypothetical protein
MLKYPPQWKRQAILFRPPGLQAGLFSRAAGDYDHLERSGAQILVLTHHEV